MSRDPKLHKVLMFALSTFLEDDDNTSPNEIAFEIGRFVTEARQSFLLTAEQPDIMPTCAAVINHGLSVGRFGDETLH